jgi:hypothetical protein
MILFFKFKSNDFFLKKTMIKFIFFILIFHICAKFLTQKKRLIMTCVFECFQSHCHIFEKNT